MANFLGMETGQSWIHIYTYTSFLYNVGYLADLGRSGSMWGRLLFQLHYKLALRPLQARRDPGPGIGGEAILEAFLDRMMHNAQVTGPTRRDSV